MKTIIKLLAWFAANTRLLCCFLVALLIHVALIGAFGRVRLEANRPRIVASFDAGPLPPPANTKEAEDPNAAYRDLDYGGQTLGAGGGTAGKGSGGVPTAGGGTPEFYQAHLASLSSQPGQDSVADVIGVVSDGATAVARPEGGPTGVGLTTMGGLGDTAIGTAGIKGPGGGIFGARMGPQHATNLNQYNGSSETERAVVTALRWLKAHQEANGSWTCGRSTPAGTALATLAFLGHGETPDSSEFGGTVSRALDYLSLHVGSDGLISDASPDYIGGDSQGLVALALAEGYAMTQSPVLRDPLQRVLTAIVRAQSAAKANAQHVGGWRYGPSSDDSDVSVTGWMIMALTSARAAGLDVPPEVCHRAAQFLWNMYDVKNPGFGYQTPERSPSMTAIGVFCQQLLGNGKDQRIKASLDYLQEQKADWDKTQGDYILYGWFYITQAMFQAGGSYWQHWNREIRDLLINKQRSDGRWMPPPNSTMETRELAATPAYSTALGALILEVYYRLPPINQLIDQGNSATSTTN
ncbi:MAG: prenyltransferase/squalene oxidase repeat-containing protein [Verrucomicrobiia bacterium]|jgi:hypothetical protein